MGEVVIGARSAGGDDDEPGRGPQDPSSSAGPEDGGGSGDRASSDAAPSDTTQGTGHEGAPTGAGASAPGTDGAGTTSGQPPGATSGTGGARAGADGVSTTKGAAGGSGPTTGHGSRWRIGRGGRDGRRGSGGDGRTTPFWKELPLLLVVALVLALVIKTFFVQAFSIPSASMEDTIKIGDRVLVDKLTPWFGSEPSRGEVVVFHDPGGWLNEGSSQSSNGFVRAMQTGLSWIGLMPSANEKDLIKRVIGVGGDTVACCDDQGRLTVNGKPLNEPYLKPGVRPSETTFSVTVPKGRLWLMGDNRSNSSDSRYHMDQKFNGTVSQNQVIGRAFIVIWPLGRMHILGVPGTFDQKFTAAALGGTGPFALGVAGAVPLVLWRRRWSEPRLLGPTAAAPPR